MMKTVINYLRQNNKDRFIFFRPNADTKNKEILNLIKNSVRNFKNFEYISSINYKDFIKLLANSKAILGNSSSGILEAPSLKIPTINIGFRQQGRLKSKSIVDCKGDVKSLKNSFRKINSLKFRKLLKKAKNPYFNGDSSQKISDILSKEKTFKDISLVRFFNTNIDKP